VTESLETIRDECERSQARADEMRLKRTRRRYIWTIILLVLVLAGWIGFGLVLINVISF
jgi:type VI protein secretion system component VasF